MREASSITRSTDANANIEADKSFSVRIDRTGPAVTCSAVPSELRPPNGRFVPVAVGLDIFKERNANLVEVSRLALAEGGGVVRSGGQVRRANGGLTYRSAGELRSFAETWSPTFMSARVSFERSRMASDSDRVRSRYSRAASLAVLLAICFAPAAQPSRADPAPRTVERRFGRARPSEVRA